MTSSESKINDPFKVLVRVGVSIPLIILIIVVWAYFIIQASMPLVKNQQVEIDCSSADDQTTCNNLNCVWTPPNPPVPGSCSENQEVNNDSDDGLLGWSPFKSFCEEDTVIDSDISGSDTVSATGSVQTELQCKGNEIVYNCSDAISDQDQVDGVADTSNKCNSDKMFDSNRKWCGVPGLTPGQGNNISIYDQKTRFHCCSDRIYEDNINYTGLVLYLIVTIPIIFLLIEKLIDVFIYRDQPIQKDISNQFSRLGGYITDNGGKLVIFLLVCYYLLMPLLRYFIVSYKCDGIDKKSSEVCGYKSCESDGDCATTRNTGCYMCIDNICSNPDFTDNTGQTYTPVDIQMSVCSIKSILNDLQQEEINDIADQFGISTKSVSGINDYIGSDTTKEKMVTSYYYKFYPRQELSINDTNSPFRARLPNPKDITGFNYKLNNYLVLKQDTDDSSANCSTLADKDTCNENLNCSYENGSCVAKECPNPLGGNPLPNRYLLPKFSGLNSVQNTTSELDLHNKVIRSGIDHGNSNDNIYPCNDVVISYSDKSGAKSDLENNAGNISTINGSWINQFELKRVECADKMGQCYMDDYICETEYGVGIPLKKLEHPRPKEYTIGEFTDIGCQKAMYPCTDLDSPCLSLDYDDNGYLTETTDGGYCKQVQWHSGNWQIPDPTIDSNLYPPSNKCVPNKFLTQDGNFDIIETGIGDTIANAKAADWLNSDGSEPGGSDPDLPTTECKSVNRITRTNIDNTPPSNLTNYFRWKSVSSETNSKCSDWLNGDGGCPPGKLPLRRGTYTASDIEEDKCCVEEGSSTPVSLYAGGDSITGTPNDIPPQDDRSPTRRVSTVFSSG